MPKLILRWVRRIILLCLQPLIGHVLVVMAAPLHDVVLYASTPTVIEGTTYDIPIIVHSCVEVLRRTGKSMIH
jgi:hypothetical protein